MDKLNNYPNLIHKILSEYIDLSNSHSKSDIETFLIVDPSQTHFIWMNVGWQNGDRIAGMTVYVRIKDSKFWIEEDWTEAGITTDLLEAGVPKDDIVLAFHEPSLRKHTAFANVSQ